MMRTTTLAVAVATVAFGLATTSRDARAVDYPYCAIAGGMHAYENCGYYTLEQCLAAVNGVGGHCSPNPRYVGTRSYSGRYDDEPRSNRRYR